MKNHCLNVWKAIAAFFVVFIHCHFPGAVGVALDGLARFAVPLFFMTSGYFAYGADVGTLRRRGKKILYLFALANVVYFLWKLLMLCKDGALTGEAVAGLFTWEALWQLLLFNQSPFIYHLWFLGALFYCYLFYALLVRTGKEERCYALIPLCLAANLLLGEGLTILGHALPLYLVRSFWLTGLPFFLAGAAFAARKQQGRRALSPAYALAVATFGAGLSLMELLLSGGAELYFGSILMVGSFFEVALQRPEFGEGSVLARIGERDATGIYLWQILVYDASALLASAVGIRETQIYLWLAPLWVCLLSWGLAEAVNRLPRGRR